MRSTYLRVSMDKHPAVSAVTNSFWYRDKGRGLMKEPLPQGLRRAYTFSSYTTYKKLKILKEL